MAQMNLRGAQLDIADVASEILSDPTATATFDGDYARLDGTNGPVADGAIQQSNVTQHEAALTITESQISDLGSYVALTDSIDALADVDTTTSAPSPGEVLSWNGSNWVPSAPGAPGAHASTHEAASAGGTDVIDGDVLEITFPGGPGYTPAPSAPPYTTAADQLTSHLAGIEMALGVAGSHISSTSNPHSVTKAQVGLGEVEDLKVNLTATAAPSAATDDVTLGYSVGSRWFDVTNDKEYVCLDATDGAAVWLETTASGGSTTWGSITGTLSSQTDLQSALDAKAASSHTHTHTDITDFDSEVNSLADARIGAADLGDIGDVTLTSIASGELLKWNGSGWENNTLAEAGIAAAAHGHSGTYVEVAGDTMTGALTLSGDPTMLLHAATKQYVDTVAAGLDFKESCHISSASGVDYDGTYNNGASGVGATLTANTAGVLPFVDGHGHATVGTRILLQDQTAGLENGIYEITNPGAGEEFTAVTCGADVSNSLDALWWEFNDATTNYYVWYDASGSAVDPTPGGKTGIEVTISTNDTAEAVATATAAAINGSAAAVSAGVAADGVTVHVLDDATGTRTDAADTGSTGFSVSVLIQGTGTPVAWVLTRTTDADSSSNVSGGMFTFVEHGATRGGNAYVLTEPTGAASIGVDALVFTLFNQAGGGAVTSVFGRTGAVVAVGGDYDASEITNVAAGNIVATDVQAAINELDTEKLALAGGTMTGTLAMNSQKITNAELDVYSEEHNDAGNATGTISINLNDGNDQRMTVTGAVVVSFTNPASSGKVSTLVLEIINGGSAAVTWPGSVQWPGGTAPTLTASGTDIIAFRTRDGGTTWFGMVGGLAFA